MRSMVIATAGHVDHGKTTLIAALTGIATDRLEEEKQRGLTIVNGYAYVRREDDWVHVLDVPGHERFVKNMLSGLDSVDLALLVIAADEGVMPQTREHLAIVELLGVSRLLVALTKIDRADETMQLIVHEEVEELLLGTSFEGAPVFEVDSVSKKGIESLRDALFEELARHAARPAFYPRLAADRHFKQRGAGDIVTGTLEGAPLKKGDTLSLYPGGELFRIRGLQVHSQEREEVLPDNRVALQLSGKDNVQLERGDVLAQKDVYATSDQMLVRVRQLLEMESDRRISVYFGSRELKGKLRFFSEEGALLQLEEKTLCFFGQRAIVRSESPALTLGSVEVLDPIPPRGRRVQKERMEKLLSAHSLTEQIELILQKYLWGATEQELERERTKRFSELEASFPFKRAGGRLFSADTLERAVSSMQKNVELFFEKNPLRHYVEKEEFRSRNYASWPRDAVEALLQLLQERGQIRTEESRLYLLDHTPQLSESDAQLKESLLQRLEEAKTQPLEKTELLKENPKMEGVLRYLRESGDIIFINDELIMKKSWLNYVVNDIIDAIKKEGPLEIADFRKRLHLSRKFLVPLLEYTDARQITRRIENRRILSKESAYGSNLDCR